MGCCLYLAWPLDVASLETVWQLDQSMGVITSVTLEDFIEACVGT
jgi:hypothetical protein